MTRLRGRLFVPTQRPTEQPAPGQPGFFRGAQVRSAADDRADTAKKLVDEIVAGGRKRRQEFDRFEGFRDPDPATRERWEPDEL